MKYSIPLVNGVYRVSDVVTSGSANDTNNHVLNVGAQPNRGFLTVEYKPEASIDWVFAAKYDFKNPEIPVYSFSGKVSDYRFTVVGASGGTIELEDTEYGVEQEPFDLTDITGGMTPEEIGNSISDSVGFSDVDFIADPKNLFNKETVLQNFFSTVGSLIIMKLFVF